VIREYVGSDQLKAVAERAAWLGNDETHYKRRWEDKDLTHLKTLVDLTIYWIEAEITTAEFIESMPSTGAGT